MLFETDGKRVALGLLHRNEILDSDRVEQLTSQAFRGDTGANALARRIDRRRRTRGTAAHHQHVEGRLRAQTVGVARRRARIELGDDFRQFHPPLAERLAVQIDRRHRHHLAAFDLGLKHRAIDHGVLDPGIDHRHEIQGLHHVGTTLAGQRHEGLEAVLALERTDLLDHRRIDLGRIAAGLQQRQNQRGELMAHRETCEADARLPSRRSQRE